MFCLCFEIRVSCFVGGSPDVAWLYVEQTIGGQHSEVQAPIDALIADLSEGDKAEPSFHTTPQYPLPHPYLSIFRYIFIICSYIRYIFETYCLIFMWRVVRCQ